MKTLKKIKWEKNSDFMDNSVRYTFEGRDPQTTVSDITVVIYTEKQRKFSHDPASVKTFYYGYVRNEKTETSDTIGRFGSLVEAKQETLKLFEKYCELYPEHAEAW